MCASWRPTFLEYGYPEEVVDEWIAKARDEMVNLRAHTYVGVSFLAKLGGGLLSTGLSHSSDPGKLGAETGNARRSTRIGSGAKEFCYSWLDLLGYGVR